MDKFLKTNDSWKKRYIINALASIKLLSNTQVIFPSTLSKGMREMIHDTAKVKGLKSISYGHDENRYVTVM